MRFKEDTPNQEVPDRDDLIDVEEGPAIAEQPPEPSVVRTMFGETNSAGSEEEKSLLRIRNTITDALNRHARFSEERASERTPYQIEHDPVIGYYEGLEEIDHGRKARNGLIQNDHSTFESIRQQIDTLQRMLRENKRKQ